MCPQLGRSPLPERGGPGWWHPVSLPGGKGHLGQSSQPIDRLEGASKAVPEWLKELGSLR